MQNMENKWYLFFWIMFLKNINAHMQKVLKNVIFFRNLKFMLECNAHTTKIIRNFAHDDLAIDSLN